MSLKGKINDLCTTEGGYLSTRDYMSYGFAGLGQNMVYGIMNSYLMIFYTDVFLIPSTAVGTMFLIAKLWDAINDPIMGTFVDKTRSKYGKMRPYLLYTPVPIALITIMLFIAPDLSSGGKMIYMYVTYILWGMIYTVCDVPYWSLSSVLTPNIGERTKLVSFTRFLTGIGMGAPVVVVSGLMYLKNHNKAYAVAGSNAKVYLVTAIIMSVVGCSLLSLGFFGTKERVQQNEKAPTLKENLGFLVKNKNLMMILLCNLLAFPKAIQGTAMTYVATYLLGGGQWVIILGIPTTVAGILSYMITPWMVRKFGAIKAYIIANIYTLIPMGLLYFIGYGNIPLILVFVFLMGLAGGTIGVIPTILIADCVDYMELQTGQRSEGVSFSVQTFMAKASSALQGWVSGLLLAAFCYVAPITVNGIATEQAQSASTMKGLWAMYTIIPALGSIFCVIPLLFYDLKGKKLEDVQLALKEKREQLHREVEE